MTLRKFLETPLGPPVIGAGVLLLVMIVSLVAIAFAAPKSDRLLSYHDDNRHVTCWRVEGHDGLARLPDRAFEELSSVKSVDKP